MSTSIQVNATKDTPVRVTRGRAGMDTMSSEEVKETKIFVLMTPGDSLTITKAQKQEE